MSRRLVLIDGYNVILRSDTLKPGPDRTLRESREKLVNLLSWVVGGDQVEFLIVFDGAHDVGPPERSARVEVRFSRPPAKADDVIRTLVEQALDNEREVTVVTADLEVARHARAMGATIALSDLFMASALGPRKSADSGDGDDEAAEKPATLSKKEIEEWAEVFRKEQKPDGAPPGD